MTYTHARIQLRSAPALRAARRRRDALRPPPPPPRPSSACDPHARTLCRSTECNRHRPHASEHAPIHNPPTLHPATRAPSMGGHAALIHACSTREASHASPVAVAVALPRGRLVGSKSTQKEIDKKTRRANASRGAQRREPLPDRRWAAVGTWKPPTRVPHESPPPGSLGAGSPRWGGEFISLAWLAWPCARVRRVGCGRRRGYAGYSTCPRAESAPPP